MSNKKKNLLNQVEANCMQMADKAHKDYMKQGDLPTGKFSIAAYRNVISIAALKVRMGKKA